MTYSIDLQSLRDPSFGIVDAAMVEHLPKWMIVEPLVPRRLTESAHLMPALIDLRRAPIEKLDLLRNYLNETCENGETPTVALFITTDSSAGETTRHWNAMQIAEPQRGRKLWLRLHDPRVLHQILRVLDPMQRRKLFGLSQAFTYWVGGEWVTAVRDTNSVPDNQVRKHDSGAPYAGPARWNWNRIERIGAVNRALIGAGISDPGALLSQGALAEQLIERAAVRHALFEQADQVEFAVRGLKTNFAFDEHSDVARAIRRDTDSVDDSSLADRFALIDEQVWSLLHQSVNLPGDTQ